MSKLDIEDVIEPMWYKDFTNGLVLEIGHIKGEPVEIELGKGLCNHILVTGNMGTGKTNVARCIISNAVRDYSPTDLRVQNYTCYDTGYNMSGSKYLPHMDYNEILSEPEEYVDVFKDLAMYVHKLLKYIKANGYNDIVDFNNAVKSGELKVGSRGYKAQKLPRTLIVVDEYVQVLYNLTVKKHVYSI